MKTLAIELWAGQVRGDSLNRATRVAPNPLMPLVDVRCYFMHAYPTFADACRAVDEPGVALVAIDEITALHEEAADPPRRRRRACRARPRLRR